MTRQPVRRMLMRGAATSVVAVSALGLTGCSDDTADAEPANETQESEDPARPFVGPYGADFYGDLDSFEGEEVTVSAEVERVVDDTSFLIASTEDANTEALLVVDAGQQQELEPGDMVSVTGTVETSFDLTEVEEDLAVDLDPENYASRDSEPYIVASDVTTE